jgi:MazG family protein
MSTPRSAALEHLLTIIDALRAPDGCPWDRKQTVASMASFVLEEGYELVEAIEQGDDRATEEELGDVLMVLMLIARIASEEGRFDIEGVARRVSDKLVRRHPHVFGEGVAEDAEAVLVNWEAIKKEERTEEAKDSSALAGLPVALPALLRAGRACGKARSSGFRWRSPAGALEKVGEELEELRAELAGADLESHPRAELSAEQKARVAEELGDLMLATAFLGDYLRIDPEEACRAALRRFEGRFRVMEEALGGELEGRELEELMAAWQAAKRQLGQG